jgi:hypothetical protein
MGDKGVGTKVDSEPLRKRTTLTPDAHDLNNHADHD